MGRRIVKSPVVADPGVATGNGTVAAKLGAPVAQVGQGAGKAWGHRAGLARMPTIRPLWLTAG